MATLLEEMKTETMSAVEEAQRHNALIKERYRRLQDAEADQFAEETHIERNATSYTVRASVLAPEAPTYVSPVTAETPVLEQVPQVTEFVREEVAASVFTTEKFDRLQEFNGVSNSAAAEVVAPTYVAPVFQNAAAATMEVEQYVLSSFAKKVIAGVGAAIVTLMSIVGINTHVINNKKAQLRSLQNRQQELVNENARVQEEIEIATSEDTIRAWAEQQINGN